METPRRRRALDLSPVADEICQRGHLAGAIDAVAHAAERRVAITDPRRPAPILPCYPGTRRYDENRGAYKCNAAASSLLPRTRQILESRM